MNAEGLFTSGVLLVADHDEEGTVGFVATAGRESVR